MADHLRHGRGQALIGEPDATARADPDVALCRLDDIPDGGGRGFVIGSGTSRRAIFVIRAGAHIFGYMNSCPHVGTPLDWVPDQFMDRDGRHILCGTHGARFRVEDGFCISGPCAGKSLTPVVMGVRGNDVILATPESSFPGN